MHMAVRYASACGASGRTVRGSHKDVTSRDYSRVPRVARLASTCLLLVRRDLLGSVPRLAVSQHEPATVFAVCAPFGSRASGWCVLKFVRDYGLGLKAW